MTEKNNKSSSVSVTQVLSYSSAGSWALSTQGCVLCFTCQQSLSLSRADPNYSTMFNDSKQSKGDTYAHECLLSVLPSYNCKEVVVTDKKQDFFNLFKLFNSVLLSSPEHGNSKAELRNGEIRYSS